MATKKKASADGASAIKQELAPSYDEQVAALTAKFLASSEGRVEVVNQASAEKKAYNAAKKAGAALPPCPAIAAVEAATVQKIGKKVKSSNGKRSGTTNVTFYVNGTPRVLRNRTYRLGYLAREAVGRGAGKTERFRAMLAEAGITDPDTTEWTFTLPDGRVLSTTVGLPQPRTEKIVRAPKASKPTAKTAKASKPTAKTAKASKPTAKTAKAKPSKKNAA